MGRLMGGSDSQLWRVRFWHESAAGMQLGAAWFGGPYLNRNVAVREGRRKARQNRTRQGQIQASALTANPPREIFLRWQVESATPEWTEAEGDSASG